MQLPTSNTSVAVLETTLHTVLVRFSECSPINTLGSVSRRQLLLSRPALSGTGLLMCAGNGSRETGKGWLLGAGLGDLLAAFLSRSGRHRQGENHTLEHRQQAFHRGTMVFCFGDVGQLAKAGPF